MHESLIVLSAFVMLIMPALPFSPLYIYPDHWLFLFFGYGLSRKISAKLL